jgi:hypothetical protein
MRRATIDDFRSLQILQGVFNRTAETGIFSAGMVGEFRLISHRIDGLLDILRQQTQEIASHPRISRKLDSICLIAQKKEATPMEPLPFCIATVVGRDQYSNWP